VLRRHHHCENNELSELSVLRYKEQVYAFVETPMPHAIQIRQTGGPEVLNWTPIEVGAPGSGQVRLRQAAAGLNYIDVYHRTGYYSQPLSFIPGLEGAGTVEAIGQDVRGLKVGDLLSQKGSLFLTRPLLLHYIARREELEASANELFDVVASGKVRINVNQRFALKDAADAHKALGARATSGSTVLTI
jgi:NADPH:quinone reductase-like Zn-dependent oxidoreductase